MISVKLSELAQKQVKELRKKCYSIPNDVLKLIEEIEMNPKSGYKIGWKFIQKTFRKCQ